MIRAHIRPVLKFVAALVLFLFGLYLLGLSLRLHPLTPSAQEELSLDPLPVTTDRTDITINGSAKPGETVEVRVNGRSVRNVSVSDEGRYSALVMIGKRSNSILVLAKSKEGNLSGSVSANVAYKSLLPKLPEFLVRFEKPTGENLLVGTTDYGEMVYLAEKNGKLMAGSLPATGDNTGFVVLEIPADCINHAEEYSVRSNVVPNDGVTLASLLHNIPLSTISRVTKIDLTEKAFEVAFDLRTASALPQIERLITGEITNAEFIRGIFGRPYPYPDDLLDDGRFLSRSISTTEKGDSELKFVFSVPFMEDERNALRLDVESWRAPVTRLMLLGASGLGEWPLLTSNDKFILHFGDIPFTSLQPVPTHIAATEVEWEGPLQNVEIDMTRDEPIDDFQFRSEKPDSARENQPAPTVREILNDVRLPVLASTVGWALIQSIPFLWLLFLLRENSALLENPEIPEWRGRFRTATVCVILAGLSLWYVLYRANVGIQEALTLIPSVKRTWLNADPTEVFLALYLSFLIVVRQFIRSLDETTENWLGWSATSGANPPRRWRQWCFWIFGAVLGIATILLWQLSDLTRALAARGIATDEMQSAVAFVENWRGAFWVFILSLVLVWLAGWRIGFSFAALSACGIALISVALALHLRYEPSTSFATTVANDVLRRVGNFGVVASLYVTVLLLCFVLSFSVVPRRMLGSRSRLLFMLSLGILLPVFSFLPARWTSQLSAFLLVVIAAWLIVYLSLTSPTFARWHAESLHSLGLWIVVVAAIFVLLVPQGARSAPTYTGAGFFPLLNQFIYLWAYFPLVGILIWFNCRQTNQRVLPQKDELPLACFLFSVYLAGYSSSWFYVPIPLLIGHVIARAWLLREPPSNDPSDDIRSTTTEALAKLIKWRWTERLARSVRKGREKKLEKGELTPDEYDRTLATLQSDFSDSLKLSDRKAKEALQETALANGPTGSAWSNAIVAFRYSVPLSLVPVTLSIYDFAATDQNQASFPVLEFVLQVVLSLANWLVFALFFGYFYTFIRGKSGLVKGVFLAAGIALPSLCLRLLETQSIGDLRLFLLWAIQVFAFCALLGFAFDYETLRRSGFSFPDLLSLHSTPTLSAFASSLVAVLVPTIVAVTKGEVLDLVKFLTERVIPQVPGK